MSGVLCVACGVGGDDGDYLRIHIRANSNSVEDQNVKYKVKDSVVEYLTPYITECESFEDVVVMVETHKESLENVADEVLRSNGFDYVSNVEIDNEYFPTRCYESFVLSADYYDAIIINLGSGQGDNWWCVVYPPLCFKDTKNVMYKSKIAELIKKYF